MWPRAVCTKVSNALEEPVVLILGSRKIHPNVRKTSTRLHGVASWQWVPATPVPPLLCGVRTSDGPQPSQTHFLCSPYLPSPDILTACALTPLDRTSFVDWALGLEPCHTVFPLSWLLINGFGAVFRLHLAQCDVTNTGERNQSVPACKTGISWAPNSCAPSSVWGVMTLWQRFGDETVDMSPNYIEKPYSCVISGIYVLLF